MTRQPTSAHSHGHVFAWVLAWGLSSSAVQHAFAVDDENQAEKYRDDLTPTFNSIDILVIGASISRSMQLQYQGQNIKLVSYEATISTARTQLNWLINRLQQN